MANPLKKPKVRLQLDLTTSQAERFDRLIDYCELGSRKELFNVAMSLFNWATQEASKGRKIASYDEKSDHVETILIPALQNAAIRLAADNPDAADNPEPYHRDRRSFEVMPAVGNMSATVGEVAPAGENVAATLAGPRIKNVAKENASHG